MNSNHNLCVVAEPYTFLLYCLVNFISKILLSGQETFAFDFSTDSLTNERWRAYELFKAFETFQQSSLVGKYLGNGFGYEVELDLFITLGDLEYDRITVLHNSFAEILVKFGLVGILLHLLFFTIILLNIKKLKRPETVTIAELLTMLVFVLFFSSFAISGPLNGGSFSTLILIIGCMYSKLHTESKVEPISWILQIRKVQNYR